MVKGKKKKWYCYCYSNVIACACCRKLIKCKQAMSGLKFAFIVFETVFPTAGILKKKRKKRKQHQNTPLNGEVERTYKGICETIRLLNTSKKAAVFNVLLSPLQQICHNLSSSLTLNRWYIRQLLKGHAYQFQELPAVCMAPSQAALRRRPGGDATDSSD